MFKVIIMLRIVCLKYMNYYKLTIILNFVLLAISISILVNMNLC